MRRKQLNPLIFIVLVAALSLAGVLAAGWSPVLGLDLQGGVSVVLQPTKEADDDALSQTLEIIRNRVDALGVAEPEIQRQGSSIIVALPGVENQQRALDLVGDTAELRFRPVLASIPGDPEDLAASTTTAGEETTSTTAAAGDSTTTTAAEVEGQSAAAPAVPFQDPGTTDTTAGTIPLPTPPAGEPGDLSGFEVTPREDDIADQPVVLQEVDDDGNVVSTNQLGPTAVTGRVVSTARAELSPAGTWSVALEIRGGDSIDSFNAAAAECFNRAPTCPTGLLAIVLDSRVIQTPEIQQPSFERDAIQITGQFGESEAKDLALVLRYGSLPVNLEPQTVSTVSPTLGEDSLRAGLVAGLLGLALVCLYMVLYYRALGIVVILGLIIWSALNFAAICWLGETQGLALSLAGVTGLVVSVGVTVDSYVVYFERLKDDVRLGRTLRTSTERAFKRAFRTILAANVASLIGAVLLYILTVGPVRGFAFFLAMATVLDVVVAWFFIRPMVAALGRSRLFTEARWWGVARGLGRATPVAGPVVGAGR